MKSLEKEYCLVVNCFKVTKKYSELSAKSEQTILKLEKLLVVAKGNHHTRQDKECRKRGISQQKEERLFNKIKKTVDDNPKMDYADSAKKQGEFYRILSELERSTGLEY